MKNTYDFTPNDMYYMDADGNQYSSIEIDMLAGTTEIDLTINIDEKDCPTGTHRMILL